MEYGKIDFNKQSLIGILTSAFLVILAISGVGAQAYYGQPYYQPSPLSYYSATIGTYWPAFGKEECLARQDFIVEILPGGCSPQVLRTDLLEDQDVPVFCQLTGIKINPLIEVPEITSISFKGQQMPKEIAGLGFHPAQAALKTFGTELIGSPVLNNLGYLVVIVRRQPAENATPKWIETNLTALIQYNAEKALGIGRASFKLPVLTDDEWQQYYKQYSFWNGKAYLRALEIGKDSAGEFARIGVYIDANKQLTSFILRSGQTSPEAYLPGYYCSAALNVNLNNIAYPEPKARIRIGDDELWVSKGQRIMDNNCWVSSIEPNIIGGGKATISCKDGGPYILELDPPKARITITDSARYEIASDDYKAGDALVKDKLIYLGYVGNTQKATSATLRESNQDFVIIVKPKNIIIVKPKNTAITPEYFSSFSVVVDKILQGKRFTWRRFFDSAWTMLNPKASKSGVTLIEGVESLTTGDNSLEHELKKALGEYADFRIIVGDGGAGQGSDLDTYHFTFEQTTGSIEKKYEGDFGTLLEKYLQETEDAYKKVAEYYGNEKRLQGEGYEKGDSYGADALYKAAGVAGYLQKFKTQEELLNQIIKKYPNSGIAEKAQQDLNLMKVHDRTKASAFVYTAGTTYYTILEDVQEPSEEDKSTELVVNGAQNTYTENQIITETLSIKTITDEWVEFSYQDKEGREMNPVKVKSGDTIPLIINEKKVDVRVVRITLRKEASVSLEPKIMQAQTQANFTFKIGIEKRAIKLSPEKTKDMINDLNDSIAKWEGIVNNLGNLVKNWKATCYAGSAYLVLKNLWANLQEGTSLARTEAMTYWKNICKGEIAEAQNLGESMTYHECFMNHNVHGEIDNSVGTFKNIYNNVNNEVQNVKSQQGVLETHTGVLGMFNEQYVNTTKFMQSSQGYLDSYKDVEFTSSDGKKIKLGDIFNTTGTGLLTDKSLIYTEDVKNILFNAEVQKACTENRLDTALCNQMKQKLYDDMNYWNKLVEENKAGNQITSTYKAAGIDVESMVLTGKGKAVSFSQKNIISESDYTKIGNLKIDKGQKVASFTAFGVNYLAVMESIGGDKYNFEKIYEVSKDAEGKPNVVKEIKGNEKTRLLSGLDASYAEIVSSKSLSNPYKNPEVKFWESGPYKGLPAILPLGEYAKEGWYVATEPYNLGTQGTKAYTESAQPISFWICNVNGNGLQEWETAGHGDDKPCIMFSMQTGMPLDQIPGVEQAKAATMVRLARQYLLEAGKQYGKKEIALGGTAFKVGKPAVTIPQYECEDFMSPNDCHLMFNLCDPVLCPSSRCDFGGRYPVTDVVQTGIIGSLFLCLPNAKEGILVPVCLTGVHAGLDNWVMIMKAARDCLQENLETGKSIGICDEVRSIYLCEFWWKQAAPLFKVGVPWLLEQISGKTHHGGGEYLMVQDAWNKAQESVNYFTNYYGVNAFKAFQARSTEAVGTEFCKAWVSAGYPSTADMFDKLIEPESPTQFYAKFSEDVMTEATVPPTSHYKVYYRIYAGKDQGVYYNIYLKGQPQTEYYQQLGYMQVPGAVGYVPKGEQVDRTIDFTGPSSYTELCVKINAQEECGFGQVTTSFFMNELKDAYLTEQATTPITSESQCIEGTPSILPLASLNLQEGAEEALQPEIYKRGIIRICSTDNPGQTTEPARWKEVGYCGDKKIKCWLDSKSLNQSITDYGILNKTLSEAEKLAKQIMKTEGAWGEEQSADALSKANQNATKISEQLNKTLSRTNLQYAKADDVDNNVERIITPTLNQFNEIVRKSLLNAYKAQAQIATAEIYEKIARLIYENKIKTEQEKAKEGEKNKKTGATIEMDKQTEAIDYSLKKGEGVTIKFNNQDYEILLEEISLEQGTAAFLVNTERITVEIMNINKPNTKYINLDSSGDYLGITYTSAYYTKQTIGIKLEKKSGGGGIKKEDIVNMPSITADCASCSNGISLCSYDKCHKIGNCYIQTGGQLLGLKASCLNCRINLKCSDFNNQIECESNKCGVTGCIWDTDLDSCVEQGSSTPGTNEEGINIEAQSESSSQTSQDKSYEETLK